MLTQPVGALFFYSVPTSFFVLDNRILFFLPDLLTGAKGSLKSNYLTGASACARKITCFGERIIQEEIESLAHGIAEWREELAPAWDSTIVFRDTGRGRATSRTPLEEVENKNVNSHSSSLIFFATHLDTPLPSLFARQVTEE